MAVQNLENLFLRPQATDVSYAYIEGIVTERIKHQAWADNGTSDRFADLIDLLSSCLYRAGSGFVMIQTHRILNQIVLPTLSLLDGTTPILDEILAAFLRLLDAYPILLRCKSEAIFQQSLRILKTSKVPSPALMSLISATSAVYRIPLSSLQVIIGQALAFLATAKDRALVISCLLLIQREISFIARDTQVLRTTLGLVSVARCSFMEDSEVRRLCSLIEEASDDSGETEPESVEPESSTALSVSQPTLESKAEAVKLAPTNEIAMQEADSPRSSCPSLDF